MSTISSAVSHCTLLLGNRKEEEEKGQGVKEEEERGKVKEDEEDKRFRKDVITHTMAKNVLYFITYI